MYFNKLLWSFTEGVRSRIAAAIAVGLLAAIVGVARLALLGWLLSKVFLGASGTELIGPFVAVAVVMLLRGALEYWRNMIAHETAARVQLSLRTKLYDQVVKLGPAHFGLQRTGDALLSVVEGVEQLEVYFGQYLPQLVVAALVPIAVFVFVAQLDLPVAAVMLAFALITLFAPVAFHSWDSANAKNRQIAYADFAAEFLDSLQGLATLQAFGQSAARGDSLAAKARELFRRTMWVLATNALSRGITDVGIAVGASAMLALGAYRVVDGAMSLEALLIILMMGIEVFRPLRELRALLHNGMLGESAAEGIVSLLQKEPLISPPAMSASSPSTVQPTVSFENVNFRYPASDQDAHRTLSFSVAEGERVGFVGASGCGKTSIVKLLLRLYDPTGGRILIGGHDLTTLPFERIHEQIAVVNQDTYLFHGTVADNLLFGNPNASRDELHAAAQVANAHDFIEQLPQGYDTVVGERGIKLSGGQRQRVAIARAVLRDAPILVLDEALSAVDTENEAVIQEALERVMRGRTTLVFAHRLSSVLSSDRIFVLQAGKVVETGTHAQLVAADGIYLALMGGQINPSDTAPVTTRSEATAPPAATPSKEHVESAAYLEPTDAIIRAEGLSWTGAISELMKLIVPWRTKLILTFVLGVTRVGALIGVGVFSALVVAAVKNDLPFSTLLVALFVLAPLAGILHWLESWVAHDMAFRLLAELCIALFKKLDELGPAYLVRRRSGDLVATATHDVEMVEFFFAHTVAPAFVAVLVPAAVLATLAWQGWQMALALVPFLALVSVSPLLMRHRIDALGSRAREALGSLNAHVVDTIQGLNEIIAFQQIGHRRKEFVDKIRYHQSVRLPFFSDLTLQMAALEVCTGLGGLVVIVTGVNLVESGALDATVLPLLTLLAMAAFLPISEIAHVGRQLADTLGASRRIYAINNEVAAVKNGEASADDTAVTTSYLAMRDVNFTYFGAERAALEDVELDVPWGETVALVGPSGAGKTTAAHLLLRFWDPDGGQITLRGTDITELKLDQLRDRIALVTQDTYLFNDTLEANIRIARPTASDSQIDAAVRQAALGEFISALPDGLATKVGERGVRLSGGQRQRVAIARAFLKDAPVLILDEATSHLDAINEQLVHSALEKLMKERTTVVIAHRLSTVRNADRIVVLEGGRVMETGNHQQLMGHGGMYAQLVSRQVTPRTVATAP